RAGLTTGHALGVRLGVEASLHALAVVLRVEPVGDLLVVVVARAAALAGEGVGGDLLGEALARDLPVALDVDAAGPRARHDLSDEVRVGRPRGRWRRDAQRPHGPAEAAEGAARERDHGEREERSETLPRASRRHMAVCCEGARG